MPVIHLVPLSCKRPPETHSAQQGVDFLTHFSSTVSAILNVFSRGRCRKIPKGRRSVSCDCRVSRGVGVRAKGAQNAQSLDNLAAPA